MFNKLLSPIYCTAIAILFLFVLSPRTQAQEAVLINRTISWEYPVNVYGGNSFYWWHNKWTTPQIGVDLGTMPTNDWTTPYNYQNGTFYMRIEIISQPTASPFWIEMGIWQDGTTRECISGGGQLSGGAGNVIETSIGSSGSWWQKDYSNKVDWTRPEDFNRIGLILWNGYKECVPSTWMTSCADPTTLAAKFFPMQAKVTVVAVAQGYSFSGWSNYTGGGSQRHPTPAYTIDYANERTTQVVPSTDEYCLLPTFASPTSGNGTALNLTPGQTVYFRTKASGEYLASLVQTLTVKARPAAPGFNYDAVNQRTVENVSSDYEYSDNADMSGAVSGNGSPVSFAVGTTKYFRKKATGSDFKSAVLALQGVSRAPTPAYTIDYINERTNQAIPATDEYSYNSNMSSSTSGSGAALILTPGQNVYFRTKASGEILESLIQTLTVKARPSNPSFTYDATNQRTASTVSSEYEYSTNSDMSGAITGTGGYVSFSAGTTMYFRKKATASDFKSNVQALLATSGGSGTPSNIGPEFTIINKIIEFGSATDADDGFYFFSFDPATMPSNWVANYNYSTGQIYTRYEIISQTSTEPIALQFGIWQQTPTLYETMEPVRALAGPESIAVNNSSPTGWWKLDGNNLDWTRMDKVWHFGINPYRVISPGNYQQIRPSFPDSWNPRYTNWYPMKVRVVIVAVASGHTFSGWQNYIGDGTSPNYQIDYTGEQTVETVPSTDEYSLNQTTWTAGSNDKLALTPGQNITFRRKNGPTYTQELAVPARPAAPAFGIDYINERTTSAVSSAYEYSANSNMASATTGSGQAVTLTPSVPMYFRARATASAFRSSIQTLNVPSRPAGPAYTVNFAAETTAESIPADVEYSGSQDFTTKSAGAGAAIPVAPGSTVYFRKLATAGQFTSAPSALVVPARPAAPAFGINYLYERTSSAVSAEYEYSSNSNMSGAAAGTNAALNITPGNDLYFRKKATSGAFTSAVQHLDVPQRPAAPSFTINFETEKTAENISNAVHYAENANFSTIHEGTGSQLVLTPGEDVYFRFKASDVAFTSATQALEVPARPVVSCQAASPVSVSPVLFDVQFPNAVTGFEGGDLQITNGNFAAMSGSFTIGVNPVANGAISVVVKANSVTPANFASVAATVTYSGLTSAGDMDGNSLSVFPTIARTSITVNGEYLNGSEFKVINTYGVVAFSGKIETSGDQINVERLIPGVYNLVISKDGNNRTLRFVKVAE